MIITMAIVVHFVTLETESVLLLMNRKGNSVECYAHNVFKQKDKYITLNMLLKLIEQFN